MNNANSEENNSNENSKKIEMRMRKFSPKTTRKINILYAVISWMPLWVNLLGSLYMVFSSMNPCSMNMESILMGLGLSLAVSSLFGIFIFSIPAFIFSIILKGIILDPLCMEEVKDKVVDGE